MENVGIIKVEVSVPEAIRALEEFKNNRLRAFETLTFEVRDAVSNAINSVLSAEMSLFLGKPDQSDNKRNGFREREYALKGIGCVRCAVRARSTDLRPEFKIGFPAENWHFC